MPLLKLRQARGYMFNFLLRHLRSHRREDYRELWLLARQMYEEGTLFISGRLSEPFLRAAVQSACLAGEGAWAAVFLEENKERLVGEDRSQVIAIHRLMVAYALGEYKEVLRGSAILGHGDARFEILLRVLQLKTHYELGEGEDFLRLAEAFRKLLGRKKGLSQRFAKGYGEFGKLANRLGRMRFADVVMAAGFQEEILHADTAEKLWLLEKAHALQKF